MKLPSPATERFKQNGNGKTLITSWLVMTLISAIFFAVVRIMISFFSSSALLLRRAPPCFLAAHTQKHQKNSEIRFAARPHWTSPTFTAKPIYFPPGRRKAVHACELEWVLNISIAAHRQRERTGGDAAGLGASRCGSSSEG